jgi:hypothetical protein
MKSSYLLLLSIALYIACLSCSEAFCVSGRCSDWPTWSILLLGWLPVGSLAHATWWANPLLFIAWFLIFVRVRSLASVFAAATLALAASFMLAKTVMTNEGGVPNPVTGYRMGYWLWLASMVAACVAAFNIKPESRDIQTADS